MWFFLKSLQNYRKFNYEKRVEEQFALPLLNCGSAQFKKSSTFALAFEKEEKQPKIDTNRPKAEWYLKTLTN